MAAKPIERSIRKQIMERGGWEPILERIASGETDYEISLTLKRPDGQPISRSFFNTLLHHHVERDRILAARREAAGARVDHAIDTAKNAPHDRDAIQKAKLVIDTDIRVAGFLDREQYGDKPAQMNVTINQNSLHLDALRHRTMPALPEIPRYTTAISSGQMKVDMERALLPAPHTAQSANICACETDTHTDSPTEQDPKEPKPGSVASQRLADSKWLRESA